MVVFEQSITNIETNLENNFPDYNDTKEDYAQGDKVTYKGFEYELIPTSVPAGYYPDKYPLYWQKIGVANKEAIIDLRSLTKSSREGGFYITFQVDYNIDYLAIGYYKAYSIKIEALDDNNNIIKTYIDEIQSINEDVFDLWDYVYAPYSSEIDRTRFFKLQYFGKKIRVTFTTNDTLLPVAECGFVVAGSSVNMGKALHSVGFKFNSYSTINTDEFGVMSIDEKFKQNIVDFETAINRNEFMRKRGLIKRLYDKFCCFVIDENSSDRLNQMVGIGKVQEASQLYNEFDKSIIGWSVVEAI